MHSEAQGIAALPPNEHTVKWHSIEKTRKRRARKAAS